MTIPRNLGTFADNLNSSGQASLTTGVSGTLPVANGGTNATATPTAGAVPYGTGTAYAFTSAGTTGQVLTSAGASAPSWTTPSSGAMTLISTQTASSSASLSWTGLATYDNYLLVLENLNCGDNILLQTGTGAGPTYATSGYIYSGLYTYATASSAGTNAYNNINSLGSTNGIILTAGGAYTNGTIANVSMTGFLSNAFTLCSVSASFNPSRVVCCGYTGGTNNTTGTTTAIKLLPVTGTLTGKASLYGISA